MYVQFTSCVYGVRKILKIVFAILLLMLTNFCQSNFSETERRILEADNGEIGNFHSNNRDCKPQLILLRNGM